MADPASSTLGGIIATGAATGILSTLGLDPAALFWALVGSVIGVTFASATSRTRAAIVFVCVVLICSLAGVGTAQWIGGGAVTRNLSACFLAIVFHPIITAAVSQIPVLLVAMRVKFFGGVP